MIGVYRGCRRDLQGWGVDSLGQAFVFRLLNEPMTTPDQAPIFISRSTSRIRRSSLCHDFILFTMPAFSRGLRALIPKQEFLCSRCIQFSTTSTAQSGHNRWSKIKHDKGAVDAKKNVQRSQFARSIAFASKSTSIQCLSTRNSC
jgi:hypothetical protein